MSKIVTWKNSNGKLLGNEIVDAEKQLNVKFPQDYIEVVSENDGGYPHPNKFKFNDKEEVFNNLISFKEDDYSNIFEVLEDVFDRIVKGVIPIAEDPFGNLICFDFRDKKVPNVIFWNHEVADKDSEKSILFICETFTELLNMLY
ncbi:MULTISPECIES: SMI1/KNR4 family protein [Enterococcus]|uniref:Knr4/Smi1-like domain-containing protein n=2 Tax=Enterococcus TaxID=1350 RepID=A0A1E5GJA5_9ENTE|nr:MULTISPECIES: SMI1/KNR4 family protein [Enterococcus]EOL45079.1 hypothetical protein UC7_01885 [Enterococcus caccae ATCC BAA-1240]EOT58486.1 hypothetical protein I580_02657 [Enterococcus caccae ATCC BAA-1240]OEG12782.1 hypothetical protein BCR25_19415 [Enterococcus termitis]OJG27184.1 hypothetical protein RU98_GL002964 [Enterococcus caccae]OJG95595.1 hypothetical protein RV18_GL002897 [Enterococcus termitis]